MKAMLHGLAPLLLVVGSVACGGHGSDHANHADHAEYADSAQHDDAAAHDDHGELDADDSDYGLILDGDSKWQMDEHTRAVFVTMTGRLQEADNDTAGEAEWQQAGVALRQDVDDLIAGCTMEGPAHDQLHTFLMHYIPAVDELATSGAAESATRVRGLLETYPSYFE